MTASWLRALRRQLAAAALACGLGLAVTAHDEARAQGLIRDAEIEDTLRVYTRPLLTAANLNPDDVDLYIVSDPSINAFVAGGQNIFVHTGLILAADNPNEIIGVLAHETGHIAGGHLARSREAANQSMSAALISIGLGVLAVAAGAPDAGAVLIGGSQGIAMGNFVRHTQVQESAADQAATTYLDATGQSGRGLIDFFNRNMRPYEFVTRRAPPWMMTHPFSSDRVETLRNRVSAGAHYNATDNEDNLRRFRFMQAKLIGFMQSQAQTMARYPTSDRSAPARYARAVAYYRAAQLPQARAELDSLIAEEPRNPYFQELMGQILFENGRTAESIPFHRRSLELAPDEPLLQVNLARALNAGQGRQGADEAVRLLAEALDHDPENAFAWRELAISRDLRGEEALAELASAEQNFHVGDFNAATNFAQRARRSLLQGTPDYQRALDIITFAGNELRERENARGRR